MDNNNSFDFNKFAGAISADDLAASPAPNADGLPDFANAPGAISVAELEKAELAMAEQPIVPIAIPQSPQANQPINTAGKSGFDNGGVSSFLDNYGKKKGQTVQEQKRTRPQQSGDPLNGMSKREQANLLNDLVFGSNTKKAEPKSAPKRPTTKKRVVEEDYYEEEFTDDRTVGCICTGECPNKTCIFYGRDNFLSINDIIETEIEDRIEYLIASGEIDDRRKDVRKQKLKKNRYLSDISDSLLDL